MQPIVHFLLSMVAGLGVGLHLENKNRKYLLIFLLAFAATCIDLDHLLPMYKENGIKVLHNFFVFIMLPSILFLVFYLYESENKSSRGQRACLLLSVMFLGHMFQDGISGTMPFFYPLRSEIFTMSSISITLDPTLFTLTSGQVIIIIWGAVILGANILETLIYNDVEGNKMYHLGLDRPKARNNKRRSRVFMGIGGIVFIKLHNFLRYKGSKARSRDHSYP
ncbi:MAG: hypothetical protein JSV09_07765 [Thermoplasmata archaeon]|nr:MAG: hypothetical protein JSV09_07765 [Thermoplasmata archaeon]